MGPLLSRVSLARPVLSYPFILPLQVSSSSLLRKIEKIQNMMYHCSQLAIAIRGEQWLDTTLLIDERQAFQLRIPALEIRLL